MKYHVYLLIKANDKSLSWDNRIFYVGITKNIIIRMSGHKCNSRENKIKYNIIKKHGFFPVVLWTTDNYEDACERERFLIRWYGRIINKTGQLANICDGEAKLDYDGYIKKKQECKYPAGFIMSIIQEFKDSKMPQRRFSQMKGIDNKTLVRWLTRFGYYNKSERKNLSDLEKNIINTMFNQGFNELDISKKLERHVETIFRYVRKNLLRPIEKRAEMSTILFHIEQFKKSGILAIEYANLNNLSADSFYYWLRKFDNERPAMAKRKITSKSDMIKHVNNYKNSNIKLIEYCKLHNLKVRTVSSWINKYYEK